MYLVGAVKNAWLAQRIYPEWKVFYYVDGSVPNDIRKALTDLGATLIDVGQPNFCGYFWRFLIYDHPGVERSIIRDCDSRLNWRERACVEDWIESGKSFHAVRDHPHHDGPDHDMPIPGGVWGMCKGVLPRTMRSLIDGWHKPKFGYDSDQQFLTHVIWPIVKADFMAHDECTAFAKESKPFPTPLTFDNPRFCCEVFNEFDEPRPYDWEQNLNRMTAC